VTKGDVVAEAKFILANFSSDTGRSTSDNRELSEVLLLSSPPEAFCVDPLLATSDPAIPDDLPGATGPSPSDRAPINDPGATFLGKTALETRLEGFRGMALAPNTLRGYQADWKDFVAWCEEQGRECLTGRRRPRPLF
jgi:hypothetical protein